MPSSAHQCRWNPLPVYSSASLISSEGSLVLHIPQESLNGSLLSGSQPGDVNSLFISTSWQSSHCVLCRLSVFSLRPFGFASLRALVIHNSLLPLVWIYAAIVIFYFYYILLLSLFLFLTRSALQSSYETLPRPNPADSNPKSYQSVRGQWAHVKKRTHRFCLPPKLGQISGKRSQRKWGTVRIIAIRTNNRL